jgi:hypothetical protein
VILNNRSKSCTNIKTTIQHIRFKKKTKTVGRKTKVTIGGTIAISTQFLGVLATP